MRDVSLNPIRPAATEAFQLDDPALIALASGTMRLLVAPHVGGSIAAYYEAAATGPVHWLRPATEAALAARDPLRMGSFPLLPYCNRIRDARFEFDGRTVDLAGDGNLFAHALHGHAWRRAIAKRPVARRTRRATGRFAIARCSASNWRRMRYG
jgi:aldose 1-epimerase